KDHGHIILNSVENGPLVWPTVALENGTVRPKTYEELSNKEKLQADFAKDIWDRVKLLMQGTSLSKQERECKLYDEFDKFSYVKGLGVLTFLPGDDPIAYMNKAMAFLSAVFTPRYPSTNNQLRSSSNMRNQATVQDGRVTIQHVQGREGQNVVGLGLQGNASGSRGNTSGQAEGKELDEEQLAFLAYPGVANAKAVLMANLSSCDSDVLSEVPYSDTSQNDMMNQRVHEFQYSELSPIIDYPDSEITSDSNSLFSISRRNVTGDSMHMLTKPQVFYDNTHKQALGYQNPFYLKRAQRIKPILYDGNVLSKTYNVLSVVDDEETLILVEESRLKMVEKQNDPIMKKEKINITLINYSELNKLSKDFGKCFVPLQELSAKQKFWLQSFDKNSEEPSTSNTPVKIEVPRELPKLQVKDTVISKLKETIHSLRENVNPAKVKKDIDEIETIKIELEHSVAKLLSENEKKLKGKNVIDTAVSKPYATTITPGMFKLNLESLALKVLKNKDAHIEYIKHSREHADILREIVESARALSPLDSNLDSACKYVQSIQEVFVYIRGVIVSTGASGSKPTGNTKNNRISQSSSSNKTNKVVQIVLWTPDASSID
ncbi:hypothetical protein Tco_0993786, partial [Tanacetum coccineum]